MTTLRTQKLLHLRESHKSLREPTFTKWDAMWQRNLVKLYALGQSHDMILTQLWFVECDGDQEDVDIREAQQAPQTFDALHNATSMSISLQVTV